MKIRTLGAIAAASLVAGTANAAVVTKWSFNGRSLNATTGTGAARFLGTTFVNYGTGAMQDMSPGARASGSASTTSASRRPTKARRACGSPPTPPISTPSE